MQVIRSSTVTFGQKEFQQNFALTVGLVAGGLIFLLLPITGLIPFELVHSGPGFWGPGILGLCLLGGSGWFGLKAWIYWEERGNQENLSQILDHFLGKEFIYFRNLSLPGTRSVGTIDGVLLGPHGALVLQIEQERGEFACEGDTWYRYISKNTGADPDKYRRRLEDSPTWAAIRAAREVKAWLSVRELPLVPVRPVVVLTNGSIRSTKRPSCPLVELSSLKNFIESNLLQALPQLVAEPISGGTVEQIAQRLQA